MQDVPRPQEYRVHDADREQHGEPAPVDGIEIAATRDGALPLHVEAEAEQECEDRVSLVLDEPGEQLIEDPVDGRRRQRQELLFGGHHVVVCVAHDIHEQHAEKRDAAQDVEFDDPVRRSDGRNPARIRLVTHGLENAIPPAGAFCTTILRAQLNRPRRPRPCRPRDRSRRLVRARFPRAAARRGRWLPGPRTRGRASPRARRLRRAAAA